MAQSPPHSKPLGPLPSSASFEGSSGSPPAGRSAAPAASGRLPGSPAGAQPAGLAAGEQSPGLPAAGDGARARAGEVALDLAEASDAGVHFIGRIRTPFATRGECPKNIAQSTAEGRVELDPRFAAGLKDIERCSHIWLLYWMHEARRDLIVQVPGHLGTPRGTFALRSPVRPNPIAMAAVKLLKVEGHVLTVSAVDCIDGTPLVDLKPYFASVDSIPEATRP